MALVESSKGEIRWQQKTQSRKRTVNYRTVLRRKKSKDLL